MLGYDRDELLGRPIVDLVPEEYREGDLRAVAEKFRGIDPPRPAGRCPPSGRS